MNCWKRYTQLEDCRLTWFAVIPCLSANGPREDWFEFALAELKRTNDADYWHVIMYGA